MQPSEETLMDQTIFGGAIIDILINKKDRSSREHRNQAGKSSKLTLIPRTARPRFNKLVGRSAEAC